MEETPVRTRVLVKKIPYPKRVRYLFMQSSYNKLTKT
nr:MAG TPA: hypothetical protein [Caudoviricetes sp.]